MCAKQLMFLISLYYLLGCQNKRNIPKRKKPKTLSGLQNKRKDRTHWDHTNQYNFLKIISIVLLIKLDNWMVYATSVNNLILNSATLPCKLEVLRSLLIKKKLPCDVTIYQL